MINQTSSDLYALMHRVAGGDKNAFRLLAGHIGQRLFKIAYRLMNGQRELAEDAVQDALIKLWQTAPRWEPKASVEAYASRLVYTSCMDIHRRRPQWSELPEDIPVPDTILQDMITQENYRELSRAMEILSGKARQAVLLSYMQDHSQKEIAQIMGLSEKAVERLLSRARQKMRAFLTAPKLKQGETR